jgi:uncharacterized RDD family membrane protein YckC
VRPAGLTRRGLAFLIDGAIVGLVWLLGGLWLVVVEVLAAESPLALGALALLAAGVTALGLLLHAVYFVGFTGGCGQTPGKMLFGVHVERRDGGPVGAGRALGRWLGYGLVVATFGLGWVAAAFDRDRRGVHDWIAGTHAVRDEP